MQWSSAPNAGFTDPGVEPWLPVNSNYVTLNVDDQDGDPGSHLELYKALITLRYRDLTFKYGNVDQLLSASQNSLAMARVQDEIFYDIYVTVINFGEDDDVINIFGAFHPVLVDGLVEINALGSAGFNPAG